MYLVCIEYDNFYGDRRNELLGYLNKADKDEMASLLTRTGFESTGLYGPQDSKHQNASFSLVAEYRFVMKDGKLEFDKTYETLFNVDIYLYEVQCS